MLDVQTDYPCKDYQIDLLKRKCSIKIILPLYPNTSDVVWSLEAVRMACLNSMITFFLSKHFSRLFCSEMPIYIIFFFEELCYNRKQQFTEPQNPHHPMNGQPIIC